MKPVINWLACEVRQLRRDMEIMKVARAGAGPLSVPQSLISPQHDQDHDRDPTLHDFPMAQSEIRLPRPIALDGLVTRSIDLILPPAPVSSDFSFTSSVSASRVSAKAVAPGRSLRLVSEVDARKTAPMKPQAEIVEKQAPIPGSWSVCSRELVQEMIDEHQKTQLTLISGILRELLADVLKRADLEFIIAELRKQIIDYCSAVVPAGQPHRSSSTGTEGQKSGEVSAFETFPYQKQAQAPKVKIQKHVRFEVSDPAPQLGTVNVHDCRRLDERLRPVLSSLEALVDELLSEVSFAHALVGIVDPVVKQSQFQRQMVDQQKFTERIAGNLQTLREETVFRDDHQHYVAIVERIRPN